MYLDEELLSQLLTNLWGTSAISYVSMESCGEPRVPFTDCTTVKKRRSSISRQPRTFLHSSSFVTCPSHSVVHGKIEDEMIKSLDNVSGKETKLKLRLKLGGVAHTFHTSSSSKLLTGGTQKLSSHQYASHSLEKSLFKNNPHSTLYKKAEGCRPPSNEFSQSGSSYDRDGESVISFSVNETNKCEPTRKSKRVPKRRVLNVGFRNDDDDDDNEDEEIRYLSRFNAFNGIQSYEDMENISGKRCGEIHDKTGYFDGEEKSLSGDEPELMEMEQGKGSIQIFQDGRNESAPAAHTRVSETGKDASTRPGAGITEYPEGPPPRKKQKGKPSELEQQLKRAEAAHRRRMQAEKAAKEAEAEAIRKILGQDSGRKKKQDKVRQRQDELAKRATKVDTLEPKTIRWVMGPKGTFIIFSEDIGLPPILNSAPCRYPPPREKCVGPNCTNTYKYRDSKSKLPVCSLGCYKAIHEKMLPVAC